MAKVLYAAVAVAALLVACSSDDEGGRPAPPVETVRFYISVPEAQGTRIGDPGQSTGEGVDWNTLALMLDYTGADASAADPRILKTFTKAEFDAMPRMVGDTAVRILSLDVPEGSAYIYGVTYSSEAKGADAIESALTSWEANGGSVSDLTISNSYASGDANRVAKFLSVATGYYRDDDGKRAAYDISGSAEGEVGQLPRVRLVRLAAKIDIQWDAQAAYDNTSHRYTQVDVTGFTFNGGAENPQPDSTGCGRLFPDLYTGGEALGGSTTFYNDSEISVRNGRVYHYVFPDGTSTPTITFKMEDNDGTATEKYYTFSFAARLRQATWYKVNTTIKGLDGSNKIELTPDNTLGN